MGFQKKIIVYSLIGSLFAMLLLGCGGGGAESRNTSYSFLALPGAVPQFYNLTLDISIGSSRLPYRKPNTNSIYISDSQGKYQWYFHCSISGGSEYYVASIGGVSQTLAAGGDYYLTRSDTSATLTIQACHSVREGGGGGKNGGGGTTTTYIDGTTDIPFTITNDISAPTASQIMIGDAPTQSGTYYFSQNSGSFSLSATCSDPGVGLSTISFGGVENDYGNVDPAAEETISATVSGTNQVQQATLEATDKVGNQDSFGPYYLVSDSTLPIVTIPSSIHLAAGSALSISPVVTETISGISTITVSVQSGSAAQTITLDPQSLTKSYQGPIDITSLVPSGASSVKLNITATSNTGVTCPPVPVTVSILQDISKSSVSLGSIVYGTAGTRSGYIASLGIPSDTLAPDRTEMLKIARTIGTGTSAVSGFSGSSAPTIGSYAADGSWEIPVDSSLGLQGGDYVITDVIPAGSAFAHKQVSYVISVIATSDQSGLGTYQGPTPVVISDTPPDLEFAVVDGAGNRVATLGGSESTPMTLYCNRITGDPRSAGAMKIVYVGSGDVDGDTIAWHLTDGTAAAQLTDGMTLGELLSQYPTTSAGKRTATDSFGIGYTETAASLVSPIVASAVGSYSVVLDTGSPWVTSFGRLVTSSKGTPMLVNYTTSPDFSFTINCQDAETGVQRIRLYVSSETIGTSTQQFSEPTSVVTKQVSVVNGVPTTSALTMSAEEQAALQGGGELIVDLSSPVSLLSIALPWSLPASQDGNYAFTAIVEDAAGNAAKPMCDIVLDRSQAASQGRWELDLDPNGASVVSLPKDLGSSAMPADQASVSLPCYIIGATGSMSVSGTVTVHGTGIAVGGVSVTQSSSDSLSASLSNGTYNLNFLTNPGMYENYDVTISAEDSNGVSEEAMATIRVNEPVAISLPEQIETTSKKPVSLCLGMAGDGTSVNLGTLADDGPDGPYTVVWAVTDIASGAAIASCGYTYTPGSSSNEPPAYPFPGATGSQYRLSAQVTDVWGVTSTASTSVVVKNTSKGQLYTDETWTGTQNLTGTVTVPDGITLTIAACHVSAVGVPAGASITDIEAWRIEVAPGGTLVVQDGSALDGGGGIWGGLRIGGTCSIEGGSTGILISAAVQGVAVDSTGSCTISGTTFSGNLVGVQVLAPSGVTIDGCAFTGNAGYAIKEEAAGVPKVTNSRFADNTYAYYQASTGTVLDVAGINALSGTTTNQ